MSVNKKNTCIFFLAFLLSGIVSAQSFYQWKRDRKYSIIASGGLSSYYGDLNNPGDILDLSGSFSIGGQYALMDHINIRAQVSYIRLSGDDQDVDEEFGTRNRNLSFRSNNWEFAGMGVFELFPRGGSYYSRPTFNPYALLGAAVMISNPKAKALSDGEWHALRPLKTEGEDYSAVVFAIPVGFGINLFYNRFLNIGVEGLYRFTFTDYLDDVSTVYIDPASFTDPIAAELADRKPEIGLAPAMAGDQRGNPDKNDGYFTIVLKVEYYIPTELMKRNRVRKSNRRVRGVKPRNPNRRRR